MKKVLSVLIVFVLLSSTLFASGFKTEGASKKGDFSIGANLGSELGVYADWGMGIFDLDLVAGGAVPNWERGWVLSGDVGANFEIVDFAKLGKGFSGEMPFSIGIAGLVGFGLNPFDINLEILVPFKLAYTFEDVPVTLYLRLAPGIGFYNMVHHFSFSGAFEGSIGAAYNF